ncbi:SLAP domain-containing protein [Lactobacillus gigeriorum]|uniref:S-layer protein n=1 Tax=Lactobacillus gigeriorum DSM 23908 = CRBIP 24.85 TaxID=1423751 RepID=I7JZY4_9LACO|nr:SLAP domain-containing protein [Lactobacillus gigeriorum]KRN14458.1 surface layer protein slpb [Lactobacillus gigeriorum DSM 23908 = CRBIP 24.85]CCI86535.1 S-layer protein [Lactobacillus gigeriorum DSM 23908 = CRBIP 24.85]
MKKNLRIVSAAAAALLAVAPVAATTVVPAASTVVSAASDTTQNIRLKNGAAWLFSKNGNEWSIASKGASDLKVNTEFTVSTKLTPMTEAEAKSVGLDWAKGGLSLYQITSGKYAGNYVLTGDAEVLTSTTQAKPATTSSENINAGSSSVFYANTNTVVNISAVAATKSAPSAINGNIVYTDAKGQNHTALLHNLVNGTNTTITDLDGKVQNPKTLKPGMYVADFNGVYVNLGNEMANKPVTFHLGGGAVFMDKGAKDNGRTLTVAVDANGVAKLGEVKAPFWAYDSTDLQEAHFYSVKTGNVVTSGSVSLHAVNGQLNVNSVFAALTQEYKASQLTKSENVDTFVPVNDIKAQLEKQNVKVDDNGYFTAPASFTINMTAKSNNNGATATLPVTVNVDNVTPTVANETTTTKTVMHIATIYDKNGNATSEPVLRAYDSVSVVSTPVELKDAAGKSKGMYYKLAGKDQYVKVGNIDGTSRTLKHNAYVYKSNGKRNKAFKTLKKGSSKTTYGKSFMINGSQMYRVGKNQYVKVANFR